MVTIHDQMNVDDEKWMVDVTICDQNGVQLFFGASPWESRLWYCLHVTSTNR